MIINPINKKEVNIYSREGKRILKQYIKTYKRGSSKNILVPFTFMNISIKNRVSGGSQGEVYNVNCEHKNKSIYKGAQLI